MEDNDEGKARAVTYGVAPVPFRTIQVMYPTRGLDPTRLTSTMHDGVLQPQTSKKSGLASLEDDFLCLLERSDEPAWRRLV